LLLDDYGRWDLEHPESLGLEAGAAELDLEDGIPLALTGYGFNRFEHPDIEGLPEDVKENMGKGRKRAGYPVAVRLSEGSIISTAGSGAKITARPLASDGYRSACLGDSGAPLKPPDASVVMGVLGSIVGSNDCKENSGAIMNFAAFTDPANEGDHSNWKDVNRMVEALCHKEIRGGKTGANGRVEGEISPGQEWPPLPNPNVDLAFNDIMDFGDGVSSPDYTEAIHEGQTMTLEAIAGENSSFESWSAVGGYYCPCAGSTDTTCEVAYDDVGHYDVDFTADWSSCVANFSYVTSSMSSIEMSSSSSSISSTSSISMSSSSSMGMSSSSSFGM